MKNSNHSEERSKFKEYLDGKVTPEHLDDFEKDALDGWNSNGNFPGALHKMDQKFSKNSGKYWIAVVSVFSVILISGIVVYTNKTETTKVNKITAQEQTTISVEKSDLVIPPKIEQLNQVEKKKRIEIKTLQQNFEAKKILEKQDERQSEIEETTHLDVKPIEKIPEKEVAKIARGTKAIEMYLHDLLLIDYRKYRSKPSIKVETTLITGTSADQESSANEVEVSEWKQIDIPYIDYISKTMQAFSKGNYKKALTRFEEILKTYPDDLNATFYGGLCYFNLGENEKALTLFRNCKTHTYSNFSQEANWYEAKTLIAMKKYEQAKIVLNQIIQGGEFYATQATKLMSTL